MKKVVLLLLIMGWILHSETPPAAVGMANNDHHDAVLKKLGMLQTGDLVFRNGKGFVSNMMRNTSRRCRIYSHVGVVVLENGSPMVYHMTDELHGKSVFNGLKKEPFETFCSNRTNKSIGVYRYPLSNQFKSELRMELAALNDLNPRFDDAFDLNSDDRLYCTELVWKHVLVKGGIQLPASRTLQGSFIGLDDLHLSPEAKTVFVINFMS